MIRVRVIRRYTDVQRNQRYLAEVSRNGYAVAHGIGASATDAVYRAHWDYRRWLYRQGKLELSRMVGYR